MSQSTSNVNALTETFANLVDKTNEVRAALNSVIVTANSTLGNTSGNCHINGNFVANNLYAVANLSGGTIAANGSGLPQISPANLTITSNVSFVANISFSNTSFTNRANTLHTNTQFFTANVTANGAAFNITGTALNISANLKYTANVLEFSNTTIFTSYANSGPGVWTSNGTAMYWAPAASGGGGGTVIDSVSNTSSTIAAAANSVKTTYDLATSANFTAQSALSNATTLSAAAYTNAVSRATSAYTNAINFSANASNLTTGTVPSGRLTGTYSINISGSATAAASVPWTGVTNRPTALSEFSSSSYFRHANTSLQAGGLVFVQNTTPTATNVGDIWIQIP